MIKAFLKSLEDPNVPLLGPNYWIMYKCGLLISRKFHKKLLTIIIHMSGAFFVFSEFYDLFNIRSDKDQALTNLRISMISPLVSIKAFSFLIWQDSWREVLDYVTENDKLERNNQDETTANIINSYTKYCRRVTYFYWALTLSTIVSLSITPLMKYFTSLEFREGYRNGTEGFPHIFSSWVPVDKETSPGCWITIIWHFYICIYGCTIMASFDTGVTVALVFFAGKLDLLRVKCREMLGTNGVGVSDEQSDRVVLQIHYMHVVYLKYSKLFNSLLSPVMFIYGVLCSLLICASAYQITTSANATQKFFIAEYLIFSIVQLFVFCWHSNDIIYKSEEVRLGPYESDWWAANLKQRNNVLILQGQMSTKHIYTAGPFTNLTIATFITIMKGAYSYYTLLSNK